MITHLKDLLPIDILLCNIHDVDFFTESRSIVIDILHDDMKSHGRRLRGRALVTTYYDDVKTRLHLSVQCAVHDDGELVTFELVSVEVVVLGETRDFTAISGVTVCSLGSEEGMLDLGSN